jgi:thiol-disulfide isomerase/thioredoxin
VIATHIPSDDSLKPEAKPMRYMLYTLTLAVLLLASPQISSAADKSPSPADQLGQIKRELLDLTKRANDRWKKEKLTQEAAEREWTSFRRDANPIIKRAVDLAEKYPQDSAAVDALVWVITGARAGHMDQTDRAFRILTGHHITSDKIGPVCRAAFALYEASDDARAFEHAVLEKSPHRQLRGVVCFGLARNAVRMSEQALQFKAPQDRKLTAAWESNTTPAYRRLVETGDPDQFKQRAVKLFERVIQEFGDVKAQDASAVTLGEQASGKLVRLRDLVAGRPAPEIAAEDVQGKPLKLSDYRGKVVLICFWASWCGPCMEMIPLEKKLVDRLKGRLFVLLGVNGDKDRAVALKAIEKEGISWRSWWNGGPQGPITTRWGVDGWPTVFIIDHRGIICHVNDVRDDDLEEVLDKLVAEAERDKR